MLDLSRYAVDPCSAMFVLVTTMGLFTSFIIY